MHVAKN